MSAQQTQSGSVALVAGQQSYSIVFPVEYAAVPKVFPTVAMPNDSGEVFEVSVDLDTLTTTGCTVWLSGVPSAASNGGYINWFSLGLGGSLPPEPSADFTGITTVELCNRVGRRARGGDFTKLSMNEQGDIFEACNNALQRIYNALPTYFKEQTQGFVLPAPLTITGVNVTQYSKFITGHAFTDAQFGQSVQLEGDPQWNQIIGEAELLNPYMGSTGTVPGTVYGNAIHSTTFPLDRIIGNPQFANQNLFPLANFNLSRVNGQPNSPWLWAQNVGLPQVWWTQVFGNSQGKRPIMVLRFGAAPDQAYAINVRIGFWPKRIDFLDYRNNTQLPVPDQFIERGLIPMAVAALADTPTWDDRNDRDRASVAGDTGELFCKNQLGQIGSPANQVFTPYGF